MAIAEHQQSEMPAGKPWTTRFSARDVSVSLAIAGVWIVVLLDALFGPDLVSSSAGGFTRVPSAIFIAFFAWLATRVIARWGFSRAQDVPAPEGE